MKTKTYTSNHHAPLTIRESFTELLCTKEWSAARMGI